MNNDVIERMKSRLPEYVEEKLEKSPKGGKRMYICPFCGSGAGKNRTGAFSITPDGKHWKCFSCEEHGDLYDLIRRLEGLEDFNKIAQKAAQFFGESPVSFDRKRDSQHTHNRSKISSYTTTHTHNSMQSENNQEVEGREEQPDFTEFFKKASEHLDETDYWQRRGISRETAVKYGLGYVDEWKSSTVPENAPASPRLIIPTSKGSYLARDTREESELTEKQRGFTKMKEGNVHIFNIAALKQARKPIFIVEGELDALSIIEVGGEALGLGGTSNTETLISEIEKARPLQPLILALDNDKPGMETQKKLEQQIATLQRKGINVSYLSVNLMLNCTDEHGEQIIDKEWKQPKDANDVLILDRAALQRAVENTSREANKDRLEEYQQRTQVSRLLPSFIDAASADTPCTPTGFLKLDEALDGGLYEGLYIMGAVSSLGKTTLAIQLADNLAKRGRDVLFFSMEMSQNEIIAKSLSRLTLELSEKKGCALTTRNILDKKRLESSSEAQRKALAKAVRHYKENAASRLYIIEGIGNYGAEAIKNAAHVHASITGNVPIIFIDYLQILAPAEPRATDKSNIDKAVLELKRLSRDLKATVIAISSLNRESYDEEISMTAFKESGAIEYGSDVLIGLQFKGCEKKDFNIDEAKAKDAREIELVLLKNRNGRTGAKIPFNYCPMFNFFAEATN